MKKQLKTTIVYVLSIISFFCCCFWGLGILLSVPAFFIANKGLKEAANQPEEYDPNSVKAMKTAKIIAIIALSLNALFFICFIIMIATTDYWSVFIQQYQEILETMQNR